MNRTTLAGAAAAAASLLVAGCATGPSPAELDAQAQAMIRASFRSQGIATAERLNQDEAQKLCSSAAAPAADAARAVEAAAMAQVRWPADGQYLGDWREGEKLAQNGRGMTWTDASDRPADNGGSCYNCHQLDRKELSYGTIGPSLWNYGKVRGVKDPADPASAAVLQYTWGKLWNSKATNACSAMPRFGHAGVLTPAQIRDLMALLLDPASPVNAP